MSKSDEINLIGSGTTVNGDVMCDGDIRVDGKLNGSIKTKGKVVVGSTGLIDGDVECKNAEVSGELKAKIDITAHFASKQAQEKITKNGGKLNIIK